MTAIKRMAWITLSLLAATGLFSASFQAQSYPVYFPYVVNDPQNSTELILTNISGRDATVNLLGFEKDGTPVNYQSPVRVPASSQVVVASGLDGWVLGSSDVSGVLGNLRVSSADRAAQDTTEAAQPATVIVLPFVAESSGASTEIAVVNPTFYVAQVNLTVFDRDGRAIATSDPSLLPFGMLRGSLASVFGSDKAYTNASHVIARSVPYNIVSQVATLTGFEVVRGFARTPDDASLEKIFSRTDWAALPAIPVSSGTSALTFPHVTRGGDWFSLIGLVNLTDTSQSVTLTYATDANPNASTRSVSIPGNASVRLTSIDLFGAGQDSGYVKVTGTGNLTGFMALGTVSGTSFSPAPGQFAGQTEFFFPSVDQSATALTGVALLNSGSSQANVDLYLMSPQGATLGRRSQLLLPQQRLVKQISEYFTEGLRQTGGYIFVRSSAPIFAMAVVGVPDKTLSQFAAQPTSPGFSPAAQTLFSIRGKVTDSRTGTPVSGANITLSKIGNTSLASTTDSGGEFVFKNLVSGEYTVTPAQAGQMFAPLNAVVRLDIDSKIVNFVRGVLPVIRAITVVTNDTGAQSTAGNNPDAFAIFGTSEVSLKIEGANFVGPTTGPSSQRVFFGRQAISMENVNFVDSETVFVKLILNSSDILQELTPNGYYGRYDVTIGGQPPFDSTRSNALPFYILPPVPVLTSVTGSSGRAETFARYEVNSPGETLTVIGSGFREGAVLLFDGRTALNGIEIDTRFTSSTQLRAYLPPQALRFGGIYVLRVRNVSQLPEVSGEAVSFQVNNLRPEISSLNPAGPLEIVGPGPVPALIELTINGSNFHPSPSVSPSDPASQDPGTLTAITLKVPDIFPALVSVGGQQQCLTINGRTVLRVRVFNTAGQPAGGVAVTFSAPGIASDKASGSFLPGGRSTVTVTSDSMGFAPPLTENTPLFSANPIAGSYVVAVEAMVDAFPLRAAFNMTNLIPGEGCVGPGRPTVVFVSSNQLIVTQYPIVSRGTYGVVVANASPGGGYSSEKEFLVTYGPSDGVPTIRTANPLSPSGRTAGTSGFNLTVYRETSTSVPFQPDAWVNFGTVRLNRIAGDSNPDSITIFVPSFLIASPGTVPLTVTNPGTSGNTGGTSTRVLFAVTP